MVHLQVIDLSDDIFLEIFLYLSSSNLLSLRSLCKRLYAIPLGQKITYSKAYEDLWHSRGKRPPIGNIRTLSLEDLEKEVTRSWRIERNLNRDYPTPVLYNYIKLQATTIDGFSDLNKVIHVVRGRFIFRPMPEESRLCCDLYSNSTYTGSVWTSDVLPRPSFDIRTAVYFEGSQEILVAITGSTVFHFRISPSAPFIQYIRQCDVEYLPNERTRRGIPPPKGDLDTDTEGEWMTFLGKSSRGWLRNCRTGQDWELEKPAIDESELIVWKPLHMIFFGKGLLFCLWFNVNWKLIRPGTRGRISILTVYFLPIPSDEHNGAVGADDASHSGTLPISGSGEFSGPMGTLEALHSQDTPNAESLKRCLRDDSHEAVFTFLIRGYTKDNHRLYILFAHITGASNSTVISPSLKIDFQHTIFYSPSSLHPSGTMLPLNQNEHLSVQLNFWDYSPDRRLFFFHVNISKLYDLILIDSNSAETSDPDELIPGLMLTGYLQREIANRWPSFVEDFSGKIVGMHLDIDIGRLFIATTKGLLVIDYA